MYTPSNCGADKRMNPINRFLEIDPASECERIVDSLRTQMKEILHRKGAVIGISGGVDSSVVLALCVRAFGVGRIAAIMMPEKDSDAESIMLAQVVANQYGLEPVLEDITSALEGYGCYRRRDKAIARVFPEYDPEMGYKAKIGLSSNLLADATLNVFYLTIVCPDGQTKQKRLPPKEYMQIVAASNFKQRTRMSMLYYHAELRNYAVIGTANKNEHDQGFFVKYGDGGVDSQPIAHLYKTQVYKLAEYLDLPIEIRERPPTTDTYSASGTQEEFFFRLPFGIMDRLWAAQANGVPAEDAARALGLENSQVQNSYDDFTRKSRTTAYLRFPPLRITGE